MEQQQRRPATARHQVDRRAGGLDLPLFETGKEVGHRCLHFSYYSGQCLCPEQCLCGRHCFGRDDRRGLIGTKLETWAIGSVERAAEQSKST
jgi:hypothetical protein